MIIAINDFREVLRLQSHNTVDELLYFSDVKLPKAKFIDCDK